MILKEVGCNDVLFLEDGAPPHWSWGGTSWIERSHGHGLAQAALSLGRFVPLALHHTISSSQGT